MRRLLGREAFAFTLSLFALLPCVATTARSQDAKSFYQGSTVKFVVGSAPGGGYDTFARLLAPHLSRALGATVVAVAEVNRHGHKPPLLHVCAGFADGDCRSI